MLPGEQQLALLQRQGLAQQQMMGLGLGQLSWLQQGEYLAAIGAQSNFRATREKTLLEDFEQYMRECDSLINNDI